MGEIAVGLAGVLSPFKSEPERVQRVYVGPAAATPGKLTEKGWLPLYELTARRIRVFPSLVS